MDIMNMCWDISSESADDKMWLALFHVSLDSSDTAPSLFAK